MVLIIRLFRCIKAAARGYMGEFLYAWWVVLFRWSGRDNRQTVKVESSHFNFTETALTFGFK